jgi:DNA (cytosine-5)-methyltransferase 1
VRRGLVVDLFAGGGGASVGIEAALGRPVDVAINHDAVALAVHKANHPHTKHLEADIWEVRPTEATKGRPVELLWASPDCTHFSVAKGSVPKKQEIRSLAWAVVRWAQAVRPAVIMLENVAEFRSWGPLGPDGRPVKRRMGVTFLRWRGRLQKLGYVVDFRILDSADYGAPTRRKRLFIVARRDGRPVRWPVPTHGPGLLPYRTAAECIDWTLPCPSIFERERPLADKTLWRIAQGIRRFVLENPRPFVIRTDHHKSHATNAFDPDAPLGTITSANGHAVVMPSILRMAHGEVARDGSRRRGRGAVPVEEALPTITGGGGGGGFGLLAPSLIKVNHGKDEARGSSVEAPLATVVASRRGDAIVAPTLMQIGYGEREGQAARVPGLDKPVGTVVAGGRKHALGSQGLGQPTGTITVKDHHNLAAATLVQFNHNNAPVDVERPLPTVTSNNHVAEVRAFLTAFYGNDGGAGKGQDLRDPARTLTAKARLGLVTVEGTDYQIVDIGMRMLEPHELARAQFGRFAETFDLSAAKTKAKKVHLIGNSVCPEVSEALVAANLPQGAEAEGVA